MRAFQRRSTRLVALLLALALVAAACGDDDEDTGAGGDSGGEEALTGSVTISGSSTVEPISTAVAELFGEEQDQVDVAVDGPGTGDGFELFCRGETDISDASRPIKPEEVLACEEAGVELIELKVAFDGISVLTSPENDAVECLNFEDLYALVGPESQGFDNWDDAQGLADELGSSTELPDAPLDVTAPGEESGTYDSFVEIALEGIAEERDQEPVTRPDYQASGDDNVIIQGIEGSDSSFGWVGFAFAEEAGDGVKSLEVDGGDGCVEDSAETIADESYPLSRPLFIYVNKARAEANPAVSAYIDFYLGDDGIASVEEVGYIGLPDEQFGETTDTWESRQTGTREG